MKYIVNSKEVSRDTFYFCQDAKLENKTFMLLANNTDVDGYINEHPNYGYYIRDDLATYYTKGEAIVKEWYEKYRGAPKYTPDDLKKKFEKSKCKTLTFTDWYAKNGWEHKIETRYEKGCFDIPTVEDFEEVVEAKLFSVKVNNDDTVKAINEIKEKNGDCIEYVLRTGAYTEIIYKDTFKEI